MRIAEGMHPIAREGIFGPFQREIYRNWILQREPLILPRHRFLYDLTLAGKEYSVFAVEGGPPITLPKSPKEG